MSMKKLKEIERRSTQIGQIFADKENFIHPTSFHYAVVGGLIRIFIKRKSM